MELKRVLLKLSGEALAGDKKFGFDEVFGRSAVMELLELKGSGASKLLSNLVKADIIEPVSGHGKGRYKFKK